LQLNKHFSCNMTSTSNATPQALHLQFWTFNFYIFIKQIATHQAPQLQHGNHFNCNSSYTWVATLNQH
jgi:hypothetical protein